ncbi:MAG: DUF305 domain-containing protein, partial [Gammaproteobacteria bacterium]|nr:DUF305 domain-containing protein [Gammaproteobacteria bacterium]
AQAMEMSDLAASRSAREEVELMAERINLSQQDEISMMQDWLADRGLDAPAADAYRAPGFELMPGMLSPEEFEELEQASGSEFDSLYLQGMIAHHEGALEMVENLLDQFGSAQDPVLYAFTSDVTSDQTSEIERMTALLSSFSTDPRVGLAAGFRDAGQAALNMRLLAALPKPPGFFDPANPAGLPQSRLDELETLDPDSDEDAEEQADGQEEALENVVATGEPETPADEADEEEGDGEPRPSFLRFSNTDLLFSGDMLIAGNYHGFNIYDISNQTAPELMSSVVCPGGQGDVSRAGDFLIMSVEETRGRLDCGLEGVAEPVSDVRMKGIRVFDISNPRMPAQVAAVQTCRGSHTHTVVSEEGDNIYVYVSGTSRVRDDEELAGCSDDSPFENPETALYRIEVVEIPKASPQDARIVNRPFVFADAETGVLAGLWRGGDHGPDTQRSRETNQCHDITTYPELGLAAGACSGNGILLDISDPANPERLDEVIDPGFSYWHSATFNNDGSKVIFTDEWGGGGRPRCRVQDPMTWGANAFYDIVDGELQFRSHYKLPAPQTETENCVAHNGSLVPVPGRDIFVQAWYQGGISVIDFTDSADPVEIAFFDRGPIDEEELVTGGYWSAYWYGGYVYGTEIVRGLDVFALEPSDYLTQNEIDAASLKETDQVVNAQTQQQVVWPAVPVVARAYADQLLRSDDVTASRAQALNAALDQAEESLTANNSNRAASRQLDELAESFSDQAVGERGVTRRRLLALADTLEGIAEDLR